LGYSIILKMVQLCKSVIDANYYGYAEPDIIIPAFSRSGTTTLFNILTQHPKIENSFKEPDTYLKLQTKRLVTNKISKILVDGSDTYINSEIFFQNVFLWNLQNKKVIIMIRNPIDISMSYYLNFVIRENELPSKIDIKNNDFLKSIKRFKFSIHVKRALNTFKFVKIFYIETLFDNLESLWKFIELKPVNVKKFRTNDFLEVQNYFWKRKLSSIPKYSIDVWKFLRDYYYKDIEYISTLINIPKDKWLNEPNPRYFI